MNYTATYKKSKNYGIRVQCKTIRGFYMNNITHINIKTSYDVECTFLEEAINTQIFSKEFYDFSKCNDFYTIKQKAIGIFYTRGVFLSTDFLTIHDTQNIILDKCPFIFTECSFKTSYKTLSNYVYNIKYNFLTLPKGQVILKNKSIR